MLVFVFISEYNSVGKGVFSLLLT